MEEWRRQSNAKYKRLNIQRETGTKADQKICRAIYDRGGSIVECSKVMITKFNENSSNSKCEPDSMV